MSAQHQVGKDQLFNIDCGGSGPHKGFRQLREEELDELSQLLNKFSDEATKISAEEIEFKKDLVKWLVNKFKKALGGHIFKTYNTGSAYEKVQAGEAKDFDVMIFLNVRKWTWKVHDDPDKPGFCYMTRGVERKNDKDNSFSHLLDEDKRLSSLKVRQLFTSKIDKFLRKNNPLTFEHKKPGTSSTSASSREAETKAENDKESKASTDQAIENVKDVEEMVSYKVNVKRKHQGPATTLTVECPGIKPFTLDLVNSLHTNHIKTDEKCDYVAKPYDKQKIFGKEYQHLWRKSYSRKESQQFKAIDIGNQVHRKLLRIFKILRIHQSQLKLLKTYVFKNLLFHLAEKGKSEGKDWDEEHLAHRFVDMIIGLRNCLDGKSHLPVFFNPNVNLLKDAGYKEDNLHCVMYFLRKVANKGIGGYKSLLDLNRIKEAQSDGSTHSQEGVVRAGKKRAATDTKTTDETVAGHDTTKPTAAKKARRRAKPKKENHLAKQSENTNDTSAGDSENQPNVRSKQVKARQHKGKKTGKVKGKDNKKPPRRSEGVRDMDERFKGLNVSKQ